MRRRASGLKRRAGRRERRLRMQQSSAWPACGWNQRATSNEP